MTYKLFMTGGSDVAGGTETIAIEDPNSKNVFRLYGYKFFSSATDADVALTLARIVDPSTGQTTKVRFLRKITLLINER